MFKSFVKENKYLVIAISLACAFILFVVAGYFYVYQYPEKQLAAMVVENPVDLSGASFQRIPKCPIKRKTRSVSVRRRDQLGSSKCFDRLDFKKDFVEVSGLKGSEIFGYTAENSLVTIELKHLRNSPKAKKPHGQDKDVQILAVRNEGSLLQGMYGGVYRKIENKMLAH